MDKDNPVHTPPFSPSNRDTPLSVPTAMASPTSPNDQISTANNVEATISESHFPSPSLSKPSKTNHPSSSTARENSPARGKSVSLSSPSPSPRPTSPHKHTTSLSEIPERTASLPIESKIRWTDSDFMTALASQERRVLELKEELQKAEDQLTKLKTQWAAHESSKRRNEGKRLHQMRPMSMIAPKVSTLSEDADGSSAWMYEEMARRKALLGNTRQSHRRVFSGSRHARTLSLLAPEQSTDGSEDQEAKSGPGASRSSTEPNLIRAAPDKMIEPYEIANPQQQEMIMNHGKRMATELRDGLWTFWADLRQAAMGDEARAQESDDSNRQDIKSPTQAGRKKKGPTQKPAPVIVEGSAAEVQPFVDPALVESGATFWKEHGFDEAKERNVPVVTKQARATKTPQKLPLHLREVDGEVWETWDSPMDKTSPALSTTSYSASLGSPNNTGESSPRTSVSSDATPRQANANVKTKDSPIPWPSLAKLTPGQLKRTASHLVDEWERSISPSRDRNEASSEAGDTSTVGGQELQQY